MRPKILVIDDDTSVLSAFQIYLEDVPVTLTLCSSGDKAIEKLRQAPDEYICAFVDYLFANEFGELEPLGHQIAKELKVLNPTLYVVMMSGNSSKEALNTWLSSGVEKFIYKPLKSELINAFIDHALAFHGERTLQSKNKIINYHGLVGVSQNFKRVVKLIKKFAPTDETVLISGETGTGKELIARAIHLESERANQPFIAINCAALTENLFESELFGHVKGAFTGAHSNSLGKFREAHRGTVFLDEIHHFSLKQQAKILRVIEEKAVMPVGDSREYDVDFRLICASKPDLRECAINNEFLIDLFFRISSLNIDVAPLRERTDDIEPLIRFFQKSMEKSLGLSKLLSPAALDCLKEYRWLGNIRELQKVMRELYLLIDSNTIDYSDIPKVILEGTSKLVYKEIKTMTEIEEKHRQEKRLLIQSVMKKAKNNKSEAARVLGMKRSTFIWLMQDLDIYDPLDRKSKMNMATSL